MLWNVVFDVLMQYYKEKLSGLVHQLPVQTSGSRSDFFFIQAIQIDNITLWQLWYSAPEERLETWQKPFIISTSTVEAHLLSLEILDLWITDLWPCPLLLLVEGSSANSAELIKMSTCEETCETLSHKVTCLGLNVFFNKQLHHWLFQLHITSIRDEEA